MRDFIAFTWEVIWDGPRSLKLASLGLMVMMLGSRFLNTMSPLIFGKLMD